MLIGNGRRGTVPISDKMDFRPKLVRKEENHFTWIRRTIHQEDITASNTYTTDTDAPSFTEEMVLAVKAHY